MNSNSNHRTFRPLDRRTADAMIALINGAVGRDDRIVVLMVSEPPGIGNLGTNLETAEEMIEFMKAFFNKEAVTMMFANSRKMLQ
jgi:hypothetical protein